MQTKYSKEFKIEVVKKALSRKQQGILFTETARSLGVKISTLHGWIKAMKSKKLIDIPTSGEFIEKSPCQWTVKERFESIVKTFSLSEEELGEYCRNKGIFPHHLESWKSEFLGSYESKNRDSQNEVKELKSKNKALSTELRRKDKALAEAASLLILKKKVHDLWRSEEDD